MKKQRPIIRHWKWLYNILNYNQECEGLKKEERFIEKLKPLGMIIEELKIKDEDEHKWLINIIRSKKLILVNDLGQRIKIVPEHFIYVVSSEIEELMDTIKGKGIIKNRRIDRYGRFIL